MDKAKGVLKGGWHPAGDPKVHRDTWKSDLKGIATGKNADKKQLETARNHQSVPLSSLKDPDSFGPPPKHADAISGSAGIPTSPVRSKPKGGLGGPVPAPRWKQEQQEAEDKPTPPPVPYRTDTTGLSTSNLPKPPARRDNLASPPPTPARAAAPANSSTQPARAPTAPPPPQSRAAPIPPPRMNDHPDEFTPAAPPSYPEATQTTQQPATQKPALLNQGALNRLGQAGVSVPGFNIGGSGSSSTTANTPQSSGIQGHAGQLSELQQRFSKMNTGTSGMASIPPVSASTAANVVSAAAAAHKKAPPPPPPKKAGLSDGNGSRPSTQDGVDAPPPLPLSSKPRPP